MSGVLDHIRVIGVTGFAHTTQRRKFIGRNAKRDVHGAQATETAIRIYTDRGIDGIGFARITPAQANAIVGKSLAELWDSASVACSALGRADHALYDLVGKALNRPAWSLMGGSGPEWVPVYDTTLYFSDLLPEHARIGASRLVDEIEDGLAQGFLAFKVKVGRGARWMDAKSGLARDIEVVRKLAAAAPVGVKLMADANDQFTFDAACRFLDAVGEHLWFLEEPFRESVEGGAALRSWARNRGLETLLADGESEHDPVRLVALARGGGVDVLQPDIRALGLSLQRRLRDEVVALPGTHLAPHCWGSYLGSFMMLQLARGTGGLLTCEIDRMTSDLFDDSDWLLEDGRMRVPDLSGCGLVVREEVFHRRYLPAAWRVGLVDGG
ncbi:MAG TPA: enolase C-terminal domain-like protein [Acidimicrobiia bacterium]|nr:enolase C-terminal domain-like protein [Acidimicrobiia bacterium]